MFYINIMTYIICIHRTMGDVRDDYAENFLQLKENNEFLPSRYMKYLKSKYETACKKQIDKRRAIPRVYARIIHAYEAAHIYCKAIDNQVSEMQNQANDIKNTINEQKDNLAELKEYKVEANVTGKLPDNCPARNFVELTQMIGDMEKSIQSLNDDEAKIQRAIVAKKELIDRKKKETLPYVMDIITDFERKVEALSIQIDLIGENFDRVFQFCSDYFQKKIKDFKVKGDYIRAMGKYSDFLIIYAKCGGQPMAGEDLYRKEKEFINTEIRDFFEFKKKV